MTLRRRDFLRAAGTAGLAGLAGCGLFSGTSYEYSLTVESVPESPVELALYDPVDEETFDTAAREALDAVLPDGRHTTRGFEPLPTDAYVEHEGRYFRTGDVVTGREQTERTLVRAVPIGGTASPEAGAVPDDARSVDSLPRASARVVRILHEHHETGGTGSAAAPLHDDAYVLRRPAELNGPIAGDLDGAAVTMADGAEWGYRLELATETLVEPVYETFAVAVAPDREAFHEVVLATRVDATLDGTALDLSVRDLLETAIDSGAHRETTPLSGSFEDLLDRLGLADVSVGEDGLLLWYDESLFRYGLYVSPSN